VHSIRSLMPRLMKSIVQSCCQIIHTAQPPVASWILDGKLSFFFFFSFSLLSSSFLSFFFLLFSFFPFCRVFQCGIYFLGLIGTILSVSQVVSASDAIAQRIYTHKDVRWLNHCSTQVVQHLRALVSTLEKGLFLFLFLFYFSDFFLVL
jgi:hypothetical protein